MIYLQKLKLNDEELALRLQAYEERGRSTRNRAAKKSPVSNRGSYMSAHVLLNLLYKLSKRDKIRGLPSILSLFRYKFNKFYDTYTLS